MMLLFLGEDQRISMIATTAKLSSPFDAPSDALRTFWILFDTLMFFWTGKHYAVHNELRVRWSAHCSTLTISRIGQ